MPGFEARLEVCVAVRENAGRGGARVHPGDARDAGWVVGGWNGAAARLGLSRTTLIAKMQRLGISRAGARATETRKVARRDGGRVTPVAEGTRVAVM